MLRSLPFVLKIQQRLIEDMAKATHNAGWSRLHVKLDAGECEKQKRQPGAVDPHPAVKFITCVLIAYGFGLAKSKT
jgi:hypothetical protein